MIKWEEPCGGAHLLPLPCYLSVPRKDACIAWAAKVPWISLAWELSGGKWEQLYLLTQNKKGSGGYMTKKTGDKTGCCQFLCVSCMPSLKMGLWCFKHPIDLAQKIASIMSGISGWYHLKHGWYDNMAYHVWFFKYCHIVYFPSYHLIWPG